MIVWCTVFNITQRTLKNVVRMLILFSRAKSCTCHSVFGSFFDGSISYCSISISYKLKLLYSLLAPFCNATDGLPAKWRLRSFTSGTTNQKHYPDMGSDTSSVWSFCAGFSDVVSRETVSGVAKCCLFSQANSPRISKRCSKLIPSERRYYLIYSWHLLVFLKQNSITYLNYKLEI